MRGYEPAEVDRRVAELTAAVTDTRMKPMARKPARSAVRGVALESAPVTGETI